MWKYLVIMVVGGWLAVSVLTFALFAVPAGAEISIDGNTITPSGHKGESNTVDVADRVGVKFETLDVVSKNIDVEETIKRMAREYGVNEETALRIAWCESRFDQFAKNPTSSASGVFQITKGTFEDGVRWKFDGWVWSGVFDGEKNIEMAIWYMSKGQLSRWDASKHCWSII